MSEEQAQDVIAVEEPTTESVPEPQPRPRAKPRPRRKPKPEPRAAGPHPMAGKVVRGSGPAYYQIDSRGRRRLIPSVQHFYRIGLQAVIRLPDDELEAMSEGWPLR